MSTALDALDITTAAFKADPFPTHARLRAQSPVLRTHGADERGSLARHAL